MPIQPPPPNRLTASAHAHLPGIFYSAAALLSNHSGYRHHGKPIDRIILPRPHQRLPSHGSIRTAPPQLFRPDTHTISAEQFRWSSNLSDPPATPGKRNKLPNSPQPTSDQRRRNLQNPPDVISEVEGILS
jgi:hypothetical protein